MKKLIILSVIAMIFTITISAQQKNSKKQKGPNYSSEQMATIQTKKMALALDLDANQQKSILKLMTTAAKERNEAMAKFKEKRTSGVKPTEEERFAIQNNRLDKQMAHKAEMKKILNATQYEKWEKQVGKKGKRSAQNSKKGSQNSSQNCSGNKQPMNRQQRG